MKILQKGTWLKKPKTCFEWKEQFHWHKAQRWTSNEWDYLFVSDPKLTFYSQIVDENKIQEEIDHLKAILKKKKKKTIPKFMDSCIKAFLIILYTSEVIV